MATSTFGRIIKVNKEDASNFTNEMCKKAKPTKPNNFISKYIHLGNKKK